MTWLSVKKHLKWYDIILKSSQNYHPKCNSVSIKNICYWKKLDIAAKLAIKDCCPVATNVSFILSLNTYDISRLTYDLVYGDIF